MKIHIVQKDETLWQIAQKYGVSLDELIASNTHLSNPNQIMPGMKIKIPHSKQSHSDKSGKKEKKQKPKQIMPSIEEDEQINYAPLEKEMPSLPLHFHPQTQPQLPSESLPHMPQKGEWGNVTYEQDCASPEGMGAHYKGEKHHMHPQQMHNMPHNMPYPSQQQPPAGAPLQQQGMPYPQFPPMQEHQGMQHTHPGYQQNQHPMGMYYHPTHHHMPPQGCGCHQGPVQQPMMPNSVAGAQYMMPPQGMHPGMSPAMPPHPHPSTLPASHSPYHHGQFGGCGCGGPGPREEEE